MQSKRLWGILSVTMLLTYIVTACHKGPQYPIIPSIEFNKFSKNIVDQGDSIRITITFKDGDGDLGWQNLSSQPCDLCNIQSDSSCLKHPTWSLFLIDTRDSCLELFQLPYLSGGGNNPSIEGSIDIDKYGMCCKKSGFTACAPLSSGTVDTARFFVVMKDRAGHFSNYLSLPPITVLCDR